MIQRSIYFYYLHFIDLIKFLISILDNFNSKILLNL